MKRVLICAALLSVALVAAPSEFNVKKLATGSAITVDGNFSDWNESYFIDSLTTDANVYARDLTRQWTPADFQYKLYLAHTVQLDADEVDTGWVYGVIYVTIDPDYRSGNTWGNDNIKLNPGGQAQALYMFAGDRTSYNPSCPFNSMTSMVAVQTFGNGGVLPVYEFALSKTVLDPFGMGVFQFSFGSEEQKAGNKEIYCAVGAWYTGGKQEWSSNPWDQAPYYPTFTLITTEGNAVEASTPKAISSASLSASPNPFLPATTLSYTAASNGTLKIFNAAGKLVSSESITAGSGKVAFNAANLAAGVYVARLEAGKSVVNTKLFLTR